MSKDVVETEKHPLAMMREPFQEHQIGKLPKPTKKQTEAVRNDPGQGVRCQICGGWHHPKVVHLDYVGHAALTDRLLDCDINWNWEPVAVNEDGTPKFDNAGGLWIRLTVAGQTRLGYGHADGKGGPDSTKEAIGDALRNAAMRFGAALDLWHKGDLHAEAHKNDPEPPDEAFILNAIANAQDIEKAAKRVEANAEIWPAELVEKARGAVAARRDQLENRKGVPNERPVDTEPTQTPDNHRAGQQSPTAGPPDPTLQTTPPHDPTTGELLDGDGLPDAYDEAPRDGGSGDAKAAGEPRPGPGEDEAVEGGLPGPGEAGFDVERWIEDYKKEVAECHNIDALDEVLMDIEEKIAPHVAEPVMQQIMRIWDKRCTEIGKAAE